MSFLVPAFLFGLIGIAVPVLIHLVKRRQLQTIPWAAHRFLRMVVQKQQKRKKTEDLILLLLRCLLVGLLAIAFAQPFISFSNTGKDAATGQPVSGQVAFLIDLSGSMSWAEGGSTRLDEAIAVARREVGSLSSNTAATLYGFTDSVVPIVASPTTDHATLIRELERLHPIGRKADTSAAIDAVLDNFDSSLHGARRMLVFTDEQAISWQDRAALDALKEKLLNSNVSLEGIFSGQAPALPNLAVRSLAVDSSRPLQGRPLRVRADVFNGSELTASDIRVTLSIDKSAPVAEQTIASLGPAESRTVDFTMEFQETGPHAITVAVRPDRLPMDDSRSLILDVTKGLDVLVVEGPRARNSRVASGLFIGEALRPVRPNRQADYPVHVEKIKADRLSKPIVDAADVVVLTGMSRVSPKMALVLKDYVEAGGSLWIWLPTTADLTAYNLSTMRELTGVRLDETVEIESGLQPEGPPYAHPVMTVWNDFSINPLASLRVNAYAELVPEKQNASEVLALQNGSPALIANRLGAGRVLVSAFPPDTTASNLPLTNSFVPLVQQGLNWLTDKVPYPREVEPDAAVVLPVPSTYFAQDVSVLAPDGSERVIGRVELFDGQTGIRFPGASASGVYEFIAAEDGEVIARTAINSDPLESDLRPVDITDLPFVEVEAASDGVIASITSNNSGFFASLSNALWWIPFVLVLILSAIEFTLAQCFSRAR